MNNSHERKGFTFYRSFVNAIRNLSVADKVVVYEAIADYSLDGIEPNKEEFSPFVQMLWEVILPNLDADRRRYNNGCKGGAPKGTINNPKGNNQYKRKDNLMDNQEDNREDNQRKSNVNVNVNENANVNVKENENVDVKEDVLRHSRSAGAVAEPPCGVKITPPHSSYSFFEDCYRESSRAKREQLTLIPSPSSAPPLPSQEEVSGRSSAYG